MWINTHVGVPKETHEVIFCTPPGRHIDEAWKHISKILRLSSSVAISQTSQLKGNFLRRSSVLLWERQISQSATVPRPIAVQFPLLDSQHSEYCFGGRFCGSFLLCPQGSPGKFGDSYHGRGSLVGLNILFGAFLPFWGTSSLLSPIIRVWRSSSSLVSSVNCFFTSLMVTGLITSRLDFMISSNWWT